MKPTPKSTRKPRRAPAAKSGNDVPQSLNALAKATGSDRKALGRLLATVQPAAWDGDHPQYTLAQVQVALETRRGASSGNLREQKLEQEIRKLTIANDAKAGTLIERAWVAERMATACSRWNSDRIRFEQQAPAAVRHQAKDLTTRIGRHLAELAKEFSQ